MTIVLKCLFYEETVLVIRQCTLYTKLLINIACETIIYDIEQEIQICTHCIFIIIFLDSRLSNHKKAYFNMIFFFNLILQGQSAFLVFFLYNLKIYVYLHCSCLWWCAKDTINLRMSHRTNYWTVYKYMFAYIPYILLLSGKLICHK